MSWTTGKRPIRNKGILTPWVHFQQVESCRPAAWYPGEVLGSGTPSGGSGIDAGRRFKEKDIVELEIEGIGILQNRIGERT